MLHSDPSQTTYACQLELPADSLIEYKYILIQFGQTQVTWESLPTNRVLNTSGKREIRVNETFGQVDVNEEFVPKTEPVMPIQPVARLSFCNDSLSGLDDLRKAPIEESKIKPVVVEKGNEHVPYAKMRSSL